MGKTKKEPQKKYTALFVILAILFILILVTIVYQFDKYDGNERNILLRKRKGDKYDKY